MGNLFNKLKKIGINTDLNFPRNCLNKNDNIVSSSV
uniref:Uncharacterized protein n=1 Tax=Lepeophtheirus salmonis TaxID=72036 RepID=A0A0K2T549_LEPSM